MFVVALIAMLSQADLTALRYETSLSAWEMCVDNRLKAIGDAGEEVPLSSKVELAMDQCHLFEQDFKRTLPDSVEASLRSDGVTSYSNSVVELIADEMFRAARERMRIAKEAL